MKESKKLVASQVTKERYKLVVVGDGACGKTSILTVFQTGEFPETHIPTVFETNVSSITIEGKEIELTLWDTAGQENYDRLRPLSYPKTDVILICFSVDSPDSLANVESQWAKEVKHFCKGVPIILVGNKTDLRQDPEVVQQLKLMKKEPIGTKKTLSVASRIQAHAFVECSAKTKENIQKLFEVAGKAAMQKRSHRDGSRMFNCNIL